MASYNAEIRLGVTGQRELEQARSSITRVNEAIDSLNRNRLNVGGLTQSLSAFETQLSRAARGLADVQLGSEKTTGALQNYLKALGTTNTAQANRSKLINDQIRDLQGLQTQEERNIEVLQRLNAVQSGRYKQKQEAKDARQFGQAKQDELELQQGLLRLEQKSAAVLNHKLELQEKLNGLALRQGAKDVSTVSTEAAKQQQLLAGKSGTVMQGPLAGPGAMGFRVALPLGKIEQQGLATETKKQEILQRMVATKQQLGGLAANLQRLDTNSVVAIADANRYLVAQNVQRKRALDLAKAQVQGPGSPGGERAFRQAGEANAAKQKAAKAQKMESVALGVGFPLMFGAGPASLAGSLAGSFVGSGFGGQILGGALGQMIDDAVVSVRDLGNALSSVGDNYSVLRETGLQFTAELEKQVRAAKQLGDYTKAAQLQRGALAVTGDIGASSGSKTSATEGVAASVNRLDAAFNKVVKTVSLLLGIIAVPFIEVIALFLEGLNTTLAVINKIITGVGGLVAMIPGFADEIKRSNEEALKTTAEYQNQLAEQDKLIEQAIRLNAANAKLNTLALKNVGLLGAEKQAADLTLRSKEKQAALEEEILKIKEAVPSGATAEQQAKATQLEAQARRKSNNEIFKDQIALYGSLYDQITADNINIARQKEDQERNYRDMVRDTARLQADLNLDIARKAQDLRVQNIEKENELIKRQADLRISGLELESKKRLSVMAEFTLEGDPEEQKIKIGVAEAVDTLKIGLAKIDAEAADRQRKLKTNLIRLDIENERYKYDMAVRISRLNVDNINKIAVINTQINRQNQDASRQRYTEGLNLLKYQAQHIKFTSSRDKREMEQEVPRRTGTDLEYVKQSITNLDTVIKAFDDLEKRIEILLTKAPGALSTVSQLPTVSGDTSAVTRQSNRLTQLTIGADQVSTQETQGKQAQAVYEQNTKLLALSFQGTGAIKNQYDNTKKLLDTEKQRQLLIQTGINPQLMEQQITNEKLYDTAKAGLENSKKYIEANKSLIPDAESLLGLINTRLVTLERINAVLKSDTVELEKQKKITEMTTVLEQGKRQMEGVEAGMRSGFIGQAQSTYADKITQGFTPEQATAMAAQTQALELATTKARALEGAYNDIGSAMASTLTDGVAGLVAGTTTAEQVFADFLKNIGDALIKAAQQMIAQYIAIAAAQALANMFSPAAGASGASAGFGMPEIASGFGLGPQRMFADGGRPPVGVPSLVGEKGPELFVPSAAGTIIPADATAAMARYQRQGGGSGGAGSSSDAMGDGAAATPVLSMSFETTRFLGQDYVSTDQLQAAMMATEKRAAAAGAKAGAAQVTSKLQQSPAYRRQVGLR